MKGQKRRSSDKYWAFEGGERIPAPDYAMFRKACEDAARELGIETDVVYRLYKDYITCSIMLMFPEPSPKALSDNELLNPRRRIQIPRVATAEVTNKSLYSWRRIEQRIKDKHNNTKQTNKDTE